MLRARAPLKSRLSFCAAVLVAATLSPCAGADDAASNAVVHAGFGLATGSFSSTNAAAKGKFTVPTAVDLQYETLQSQVSSLDFHFVLVDDLSVDRTDYFYAGVGKKYYLFSNSGFSRATEGGFGAAVSPVWRFYAGAEVGISDVTTNTLGLYETKSTCIEVGGNVGAIYRISQVLGIEAQMGLSLGYGFTTISVDGYVYRLLLGAAIYF